MISFSFYNSTDLPTSKYGFIITYKLLYIHSILLVNFLSEKWPTNVNRRRTEAKINHVVTISLVVLEKKPKIYKENIALGSANGFLQANHCKLEAKNAQDEKYQNMDLPMLSLLQIR